MHAFVLQDWITIRGGSSVSTVTQSEHEWHSLDGYQDLIAWIDIREITLGTNPTYIQFNLQTAPLKDEVLFKTMQASPLQATASTAGVVTVQQMVLSISSTYTVPLGKFVRWQLVTSTAPAAAWDAHFRILLCANPLGGGGGMAMHHAHHGR